MLCYKTEKCGLLDTMPPVLEIKLYKSENKWQTEMKKGSYNFFSYMYTCKIT